jgi:hypothetical protein
MSEVRGTVSEIGGKTAKLNKMKDLLKKDSNMSVHI